MTGGNVTEYYSVLLVTTFLMYLIVTDENVAKYLWLKLMIFVINVKKFWLMAQLYPKLRYNRWVLTRTLNKAMKQLEEQQ